MRTRRSGRRHHVKRPSPPRCRAAPQSQPRTSTRTISAHPVAPSSIEGSARTRVGALSRSASCSFPVRALRVRTAHSMCCSIFTAPSRFEKRSLRRASGSWCTRSMPASARANTRNRSRPTTRSRSLLRTIEREVTLATGREGAHAGHVAVSSWSAGSGAVSQIVGRHRELVSAVVLLDSLYGGYTWGSVRWSTDSSHPLSSRARRARGRRPLLPQLQRDPDRWLCVLVRGRDVPLG